MNRPMLAKVDFDDIYDALKNSNDELIDSDGCMRCLRASEAPNVRRWLELMSTDEDVHADIVAIIYNFLSESDEYL